MGELLYSSIASLDGYVADANGSFDWAEPDEEVHSFVNDLQRRIGIYLLGRRMYDVLLAWETMDTEEETTSIQDYASIWHDMDKVVYSQTLEAPASAGTRIERSFDPATVDEMKSGADRDLIVGGPTLAAEALRAGLVDECHLFLVPVVVGDGTPVFAPDLRLDLDHVEDHRFRNGTVYLRYRVQRPSRS